ncbi:MAG: hypothetical protein AAB358_03700 [Patescibacteria group bacterium]
MKNIRFKISIGALIALIVVSGLIVYFVFKTPDVIKPKCGNGICDINENWKNCLNDCAKPAKGFCGDKVCESKEITSCLADCLKKIVCGDGICSLNENCKEDCEESPVAELICGDKICNNNETCSSCVQDCGSCPAGNGDYIIGLSNWGGWSPDQTYFDYLDGIQTDWSRANFLDVTSRRVKNITEREWCERYCNGINCENLQVGQSYICNLKVLRSEIFENDNVYDDVKLTISRGFNLVGELDVDSYRDETSFRAFVKDSVEYFDEIKYWEIGNEVDTHLTGQVYGNRVKIAYEEIKKVCPDCKVGISTAGNDPTVLPKPGRETGIKDIADTLFSNFCGYFDFVDAHLLDMLTEARLIELRGRVASWNQLAIDNNCAVKELISTETNVADTNFPLGENSREGQARGIIKLYAMGFYAGYKKVLYRSMFDEPDLQGPNAVWAFDGLITKHPENEIKPAFYAFKTLTEKIGGFSSVAKITDTQYKFTVNGRNVYVLWCASGSCTLPSEISGQVTVTDYLGNEERRNANQITLADSPVFVEN